jgi:outer membrane protein OmpA-like peptidoglycan-associated protein
MRQHTKWIGFQAAILWIACSVFAQAQPMRQGTALLRHQAETAAGSGNCAAAISLYQDAIAAGQDSAWAHRGLADCYRVNGSWAKAASQYDAVTLIDSADADARQLALLTRRAATEKQDDDVVDARTLSAISRYPASWPSGNAGLSESAAEGSDGLRSVAFPKRSAASTTRSIPVQVAFPRNKFSLESLPASGRRQLDEVVAAIRSDSDAPERIEVEGHTCSCGSAAANRALGFKRAEAVRQFLIDSGVAPASRISVVSYGSTRPVESAGEPNLPGAVCERDPIHSENRRVVVLVYGHSGQPSPASSPLHVSFLSSRKGGVGWSPVHDGGQLRTGDVYKIRLSAEKPVYVYAFHRQADGTWMDLSSLTASAGGDVPLAISVDPGRELTIPGANLPFVLDEGTGVEETFIYARLEPDKDLEALVQHMRDAKDAGYVNLRPPDLPEPALPIPPAARRQQPKAAPAAPQPAVGHFDEPAPANPSGEATSIGHLESTPEDQPNEATQPGNMRGIKVMVPRADAQPQLPPDPAAFVRFRHTP